MTTKSFIAVAAVAVSVAAPASTALARGTTGVRWTNDQLQALAHAYQLKNPGWHPPQSAGVRSPANLTWTTDNLDRLAAAYAALNPGWTRPGG